MIPLGLRARFALLAWGFAVPRRLARALRARAFALTALAL
jgi:hypothetical protein